MKKTTLLSKLILLFFLSSISFLNAQTDYYDVIVSDGATSGNARAPHPNFRYERVVYLVTQAEMTASGFVNGDQFNSIVFNYLDVPNAAASGTLILYMQNTTDATNNKSTTWTTAITGMTTVSNSVVNLPTSAGNVTFPFSGGSPFTYTGGALYIAFDYSNPSGTLSTTATMRIDCNSTGLANGLKGAQSTTAAPTTIANSNFRPATQLGKSVTCARPTNLGDVFASNTTSSATLTFTPSGGGSTSIEYGLYGFTPGTGTIINNVTSPYVLGSLNNSTVYDFYARTDCGGGNYSVWKGPYAFTTAWVPTAPTYNTSFEQEIFPFIGWSIVPDNTPNAWFINYGGVGSPLVQDGVSSAVAITPTASVGTERMFSRGINLTAGSNVTITFYDRNYVSGSTNTASYQLTVGNAPNAGAQTNILETRTGLNTTTFTLRTVNFIPSTTGTYYFSFLNNSPANAAGTHAIIIDNFTVTEVLANESFDNEAFSVYPNPVKNTLNILNANENIKNAQVFDLKGRKVIDFKNVLSSSNVVLDFSSLEKGVYILTIESNSSKSTKRIIKE